MSKKKKEQPKPAQSNAAKYVLLIVLAAIAGYFIYDNLIAPDDKPVYTYDPGDRFKNIKEPQFRKEGELEFLSGDQKNIIKKIDVEIAENDEERMQGLMYRKSMGEDRGMLFIFHNDELQSFWMKNTIIPLDIIYVNPDSTINSIYKNTTPFSETSLPSELPSRFVVEVIAGFTDKYGIKKGDHIRFSKN